MAGWRGRLPDGKASARSPLEHGVRADGLVLQRAEGRQLHHEHVPTLGAQVEELSGGMRQDHGDLCGTGGSPEDGNGCL